MSASTVRRLGPACGFAGDERRRRRLWDNCGMTARLFWVLVGLGALCAALAGFLLAGEVDSSRPVLASGTWLSAARPIADFHLIDSRGRPFTRSALIGHPTLVYFGFTHCPDECPDTLAALASVTRQTTVPGLQVLFITVDPERDTPTVLASYLRHFDPGFLGLTGDPAELNRLAAALGIGISRVNLPGGGYDFEHTQAILLFDSRAREVGVFTPPFDVRKLAQSLSRVAPELRAAA
jgi:protein SCO1/2